MSPFMSLRHERQIYILKCIVLVIRMIHIFNKICKLLFKTIQAITFAMNSFKYGYSVIQNFRNAVHYGIGSSVFLLVVIMQLLI